MKTINRARRSLLRPVVFTGAVMAMAFTAWTAETPPSRVAIGGTLLFEANVGQTDPNVRWLGRGPGYQLFFTDDSITMALTSHKRSQPDLIRRLRARDAADEARTEVVRMRLKGSHRWERPAGMARAESVTNYLIGNDRSKWHTNVANYTRLKETGIYDGVDMLFYSGGGGKLEYDFVVAPQADPGQIKLAFDGVSEMHLDDRSGDLRLTLASGKELTQMRPRIYQQMGDRQIEVSGNYKILDSENVTFALAGYDRNRELTIDPQIDLATAPGHQPDPRTAYYTTFKGEYQDFAVGIALDASGDAYTAGWTQSARFPIMTAPPARGLGDFHGGPYEAFVAKVSKTGAILFSTYLGGSGDDKVFGLAADATGVYLAGATTSPDFPVLYTPTNIQGNAAFVAKLISQGNDFEYSRILGNGAGSAAIAVDRFRAVYVLGDAGPSFPVVGPNHSSYAGGGDLFLAKLDSIGNTVYARFLGGSHVEDGRAIAVDQNGAVVFTGFTESPDLPVFHAPVTYKGGNVPFVGGLDPNGGVSFLRYLGDADNGVGLGVTFDPASGDSFVVGATQSPNFPVTPSSFDRTYPNPSAGSGFIVRLDPIGDIRWGAFFGLPDNNPNAETMLTSVTVGPDGKVYAGGETTSRLLIGATPLAPNPEFGFVCKMFPNGAGERYTVRVGAWVSGVAVRLQPSFSVVLPPTTRVDVAGMQRTDGPHDSYDVFLTELNEGSLTNLPPVPFPGGPISGFAQRP